MHGGIVQPRQAIMRFTRSGAAGTSPLITAAAAADEDFWWHGDGSFLGKQPDISNFGAGDFTLRSSAWGNVTQINFSSRLLTNNLAQMINPVASRLTGLTHLNLHTNQLTGDISDVTLPSNLTYLNLHINQLTGDISDVTLPSGLAYLYLHYNQLTYADTGKCLSTLSENGATYYFSNNSMSQSSVDNILADCNTSGTTGSTLNVAGIGGTANDAPTGGAANADYVNLTTAIGSGGLGWTVTISS